MTIIEVEAVGLAQVASDRIEIAILVEVCQHDGQRQVGHQGVDIEGGGVKVLDGAQQTAHLLAVREVAVLVEVSAVELGKVAGDKVPVSVAVEIPQGHRRGERVTAASVLPRHPGVGSVGAVVAIQSVLRASAAVSSEQWSATM